MYQYQMKAKTIFQKHHAIGKYSATKESFLILGILSLASASFIGVASAQEFEAEERPLNARNLLEPSVLYGPSYRIDGLVVNKGYMNNYTISSDFGQFDAVGDEQLAVRIQEIAAIGELQSLRKLDVFGTAVTQAVKKPVQSIQNVVENPVETLTGLPQGVGRLFRRTARRVENVAEEVSEYASQQARRNAESANSGDSATQELLDKGLEEGETLTKDYLGQNKSIRQLAKQLNIDPYSSNTVLQAELSEIAWVMTAGSFGTGQILPSLPAGVGELSDLNELVWDTNPLDLQLRNESLLKSMGVPEELIKAFYDNQYFTPTLRTVLVGSLEQLGDIPGRPQLIEHAAMSVTQAEARLYSKIAETLLAYHLSRLPITSIVNSSVWPLAKASNGNLVFVAPVDYLSWTEGVSASANSLIEQLRGYPAKNRRELWVQGQVSDKAKAEMELLGWFVYDRSKSRL